MNFDSSSPVPEKKTYKTYNREVVLFKLRQDYN